MNTSFTHIFPVAFTGTIGGWELIIIFAVLLVVFGPKRLPEIARSMGRMIDYLQRTAHEFRDQIMNADIESPPGDEDSGGAEQQKPVSRGEKEPPEKRDQDEDVLAG
jgi:sec-independent protein translocase protein TatA